MRVSIRFVCCSDPASVRTALARDEFKWRGTPMAQSFVRTRFFRAASALLVLAYLAACGSDTTAPRDVAGSYTLSTIDGSALPYTVPNSPPVAIISSAFVVLSSDSTYTYQAAGSLNGVGSGDVADDNGTYRVSGSTVTFTSIKYNGSRYNADASSTGLTASTPGAIVNSDNLSFTLVFDKTS
jgi:hypothetical protein